MILSELNNLTGTLQTNLEAAARFQGRFVDYLREVPDIQKQVTAAQRESLEVLTRMADQEERIARIRGHAPDFSGTPRGRPMPGPGAGGTPPSTDRNSRPEDETPPPGQPSGQGGSSGGGFGGRGSPEDPINPTPGLPGYGLMSGLIGLLSPGAGPGATLPIIHNLLNSLGQQSQRRGTVPPRGTPAPPTPPVPPPPGPPPGGGGGGLPDEGEGEPDEGDGEGGGGGGFLGGGRGLVRGAAAVYLAQQAYHLYEAGAERVRQIRSMGQITGGGFNQGLGYEMSIRTMALNPFISTDQARKIMMQALNEGYSGKEIDTVTEFVATNLKDMGVDIKTSFDAVRSSVLLGGESTAALQSQMRGQFLQAGETGQAVPALTQGVQQLSQTLVGQAGISGGESGYVSNLTAGAFANLFSTSIGGMPNPLEGRWTAFNQAFQNPSFQALMAQQAGLAGGDPARAISAMGPAAVPYALNLLKQIYQRSGSGPFADRAVLAQLQSMGLGGLAQNFAEVDSLRKQLFSGQLQNEALKPVTVTDSGGGTKRGIFGEYTHEFGQGLVKAISFGNWGATPEHEVLQYSRYHLPALESAILAPGNLQWQDPKTGEWKTFTGDDSGTIADVFNSQPDLLRQIAAGKVKLRTAAPGFSGLFAGKEKEVAQQLGINVGAGKATTLAQIAAGQSNPTDTGSTQGTVTIQLSGDAAKYFTLPNGQSSITLSPYEMGANQGYGGYQLNTKPPGQDSGLYGYPTGSK